MQGEVNWPRYYENAYFCTIETKLRSFQIKLFLKCIVLNRTLYGFGLVDSEMCDLCNAAAEDVLHLFYYCPFTKAFWDEVRHWIQLVTRDTETTIGVEECILGTVRVRACSFINSVLLVSRFFIYRCKSMKIKPTFDVFFLFLKDVKKNEKIIAYKNGKSHKHKEKWAPLQ